MGSTVRTADGRTLTAQEWGDPDGTAVLLLHGTPGSRLGIAPARTLDRRPGVRFFAYDRPGYGGSDRAEGRDVAHCAQDAAAVADALGIRSFAVLGRSGGGAHALACAALLPGRVTATAALVAPAPRDGEGLDWFAGMTPYNVREYTLALRGTEALTASLAPQAASIREDPGLLLAEISQGLSPSDAEALAEPATRAMLLTNYRTALGTSADGWIDDCLALARPWGFDPADIPGRVLLWHGAQDAFSPVGHFHWLAHWIPHAEATLAEGMGHFGALTAFDDVLDRLLNPKETP
ncbi:alpha/beta hydrolase [Streptomyces sp. TRM66268-LWL]|uniref:Alpha/beta hydrolase n=1 Tax=Streptomyces polyasparticus TaxID=2767826 RepID=A0ABR7SL46_9ACTN|nr:alpha/beta hydrolase [Streptomyces polyasparticus]MBC9715317.1 alpha/beta hydrolase [Streptomyces polyasparticus]